MKFKTVQLAEDVYSGYWILPCFITILTLALGVLCLWFDSIYHFDWLDELFTDSMTISVHKDVLSIIAGAVITILSVTFSITILILSQVSAQLGRQLLPSFMRQKATQVIVGIYLGTFAYCITTLYAIDYISVFENQPHTTVTIAIVLGFISIFALLYFISFVCNAIQMETVLECLKEDTETCIKRQLKPANTDDKPIDQYITDKAKNEDDQLEKTDYEHKKDILAKRSGYIQTIDYEEMLAIATRQDILLNMQVKPGSHVLAGMPLITVQSPYEYEGDPESLLAPIYIGERRTSVQDIEFSFERMSEIAIRALSPGINDPYGAIKVIERIFQALTVFSQHQETPKIMLDDDKHPRVYRHINSYDDIVSRTFLRLREDMLDDSIVILCFYENIIKLCQTQAPAQFKHALMQQARYIYENTQDTEILEEKYKALKEVC